jgi:hypothetical protein
MSGCIIRRVSTNSATSGQTYYRRYKVFLTHTINSARLLSSVLHNQTSRPVCEG